MTETDWSAAVAADDEAPSDLVELDNDARLAAVADPADLLARVTARYRNDELSITERARAASIALRLAKRQPPRPSIAEVDRLTEFAVALIDAGVGPRAYMKIVDAITAADDAPTSAAHEVLGWARATGARTDLPERAITTAQALEARAADACRALDAASGFDLVTSLGDELVASSGGKPLAVSVQAVFRRFGLDPRSLAPAHFNVNYPLYHRMCEERGWRPRTRNE